MNVYSYLPIVSAFLFILLEILIVFKRREKYFVSIPCSLVYLTTLWWQGTWSILFNVENENLVLFLVRFGYSGIIFIPFTFYHFIVNWIGIKKEKIVVYIFYLIGFVFLYFLWFSKYFISGYYKYFWGYYPKAGLLHPIYLIFLTISVLRIFIILGSSLKKKDLKPIERNQIKYVFLSIAIYTFAASDFLVNYGIEFYPLGVIFALCSLLLITYAILRYHFVDINIFYKNILSDIILFFVIGPIFLFIIFLTEKTFFETIDTRFVILNFSFIFFLLLFAYLFRKLKPATEKFVEKALFKDK